LFFLRHFIFLPLSLFDAGTEKRDRPRNKDPITTEKKEIQKDRKEKEILIKRIYKYLANTYNS